MDLCFSRGNVMQATSCPCNRKTWTLHTITVDLNDDQSICVPSKPIYILCDIVEELHSTSTSRFHVPLPWRSFLVTTGAWNPFHLSISALLDLPALILETIFGSLIWIESLYYICHTSWCFQSRKSGGISVQCHFFRRV